MWLEVYKKNIVKSSSNDALNNEARIKYIRKYGNPTVSYCGGVIILQASFMAVDKRRTAYPAVAYLRFSVCLEGEW